MTSLRPKAPARVVAVICASLVSVAAGGPPAAAAATSTTTTTSASPSTSTTSTSTTSTTWSPASPGPSATTSSRAGPATSTTTTAGGATTSTAVASSPTTSTTLYPSQLAALVQGLGAEIAQAQAVGDYLAARAAAAQVGAGQPVPPSADPILVQVAAAQLRATADQAAAGQRYEDARQRIGKVAVALYLGDQVPRMGRADGAPGDRSAFLSRILDSEQAQAHLARQAMARATDAFRESRLSAERAVQDRTVELQAIALQAPAGAGPPETSPARGPAIGPLSQARAGAGRSAVSPGGGPATGLPGGATPGGPSLLTRESPTILGPSVLTAGELVGWFDASGHVSRLTVPLAALAVAFTAVGGHDGVRADIAFAQSVLETGFYAFPSFGQVAPSDNNFAGLGACDSCAHGLRFPDATTGVGAQMQLLHAYATTAEPVAGPLPGPFTVSGCCPTWIQLAGVWATAPDYGIKILKLYRSMIRWALAYRRGAARI